MLHISCNIGTRDLPDMYALSPWALGIHDMYALSPRALGLWAYISGKSLMPMLQLLHVSQMYGSGFEHTYQANHSCLCYNYYMYHKCMVTYVLKHLTPNSKLSHTEQSDALFHH